MGLGSWIPVSSSESEEDSVDLGSRSDSEYLPWSEEEGSESWLDEEDYNLESLPCSQEKNESGDYPLAEESGSGGH